MGHDLRTYAHVIESLSGARYAGLDALTLAGRADPVFRQSSVMAAADGGKEDAAVVLLAMTMAWLPERADADQRAPRSRKPRCSSARLRRSGARRLMRGARHFEGAANGRQLGGVQLGLDASEQRPLRIAHVTAQHLAEHSKRRRVRGPAALEDRF
jgi:hypothetical protein